MSIENQIIKHLKSDYEASVNELLQYIPVSRQMLHRVLSKMIQEGYLEKIGRPPRVFYRLAGNQMIVKSAAHHLSDEELAFLDEYFLLITEKGQPLQGILENPVILTT